jgi:hypothetical protein
MQLPVTQWNYKGENKTNTHIGPMAQDFHRLFKTGADSISISTIDPAGVAIIGVQEVQKENEQLKKTVSDQDARLREVEKELTEMKKMLANNKSTLNASK